MTITDMVETLQKKLKNSNSKNKESDSLSFFKYNEESQKYDCLTSHILNFKHFLEYTEKHYISQIITIGPNTLNNLPQKNISLKAHNIKNTEVQIKKDWLLYEITKNNVLKDNICVIDSIDIDPLLFWFQRDYNKILRHKQNFSFIKNYFK